MEKALLEQESLLNDEVQGVQAAPLDLILEELFGSLTGHSQGIEQATLGPLLRGDGELPRAADLAADVDCLEPHPQRLALGCIAGHIMRHCMHFRAGKKLTNIFLLIAHPQIGLIAQLSGY